MNINDMDKFPPGIPWREFSDEELWRLISGVDFESRGAVIAFGIQILSRYNVDKEMKDMIHFACEVSRAGVAWAIKKVFYDSKANLCSIEFNEGGGEKYCYTFKHDQLLKIADHTLHQHDLFDCIGGYCNDDGEGESQTPAKKKEKRVVWYHPTSGNS